MKKMYLIITFLALTISCKKEKKTENEEQKVEFVMPELSKEEKLSEAKKESSRLRGSGSIKTVEMNDSILKVVYVKNYAEYKKINPESRASKTDLDSYWKTGNAIDKALVSGSAKLLKKLDFINSIEIIIPYKGTNHSVKVNRKRLDRYLGSGGLVVWKTFSDDYVYNDEGRKKFLEYFRK